ncbi:UPF0738 family protein [Falsibacillus albus]|uniref:UPF0738 protein D9X91_03210 n=1 Tax=Falsibacillus albus TaxID=2478915 RepID=A0A3L7K3G1_9BACI|nr:hypothetical protein [Falsibacillus albus]RLQ97175.1 hypothetical protein D9X91_03210 [Falsibacillus albus]
MRKKIQLKNTEKRDEELILHTEEDFSFSDLRATGQVIVDSDALSFVYLAESDDEFIYLYIPESIWGDIHTAIQQNLIVKAVSGDTEMILENIQDELGYLIENIEGNSNYGEEMVNKVETIFLSK